MRRRLLPAVAAALVLGLVGCRGRRAGPPPERYLPADVQAAVVVPEAGRAARQLAALHATLSEFPGATDLAAARGALAAQLGLDPLDPAGLREAGVEPRRGAALALLARPAAPGSSRGTPLLVLPVADAERLEGLLARLARERLGAEVRALEPRGPVTAVAFRRAAGEPPALTYLLLEHTALVAPGPSGPEVVAEAAALTEERSLARSAPYAAARRAVGDSVAALAFAPPGSPLLAGVGALRDGLGLGFEARERALRARVAVPLGDRAPSFRALAGGGAAAQLVGRLAPGAALVLRWDGAVDALARRLLPHLPPAERARLAARGIEPERDLPGLLGPGVAAAAWLSPSLELAGLGEASLRADPLRLIRFEAVAPLADPARARAISERLASPRRGRAPRDGAFRLATPSGEIAWRLEGDRLLLAGGPPGALDELSARVSGGGAGWRAPTEAAGAALSGGLGGAVLDAQRLVASVRALPEDAFGTGPSGFVVRSVVDRFLDPAARLAALSLRAELAEETLVVGVEVEAAGPEARR
jgi:hypothetical protein